jgi:hypothetical protein
MRGESNNRIEFLATALAGSEHRRIAASLALLSVLICALLAPFAALPGPVIPAFIPGYEGSVASLRRLTGLGKAGAWRNGDKRSGSGRTSPSKAGSSLPR